VLFIGTVQWGPTNPRIRENASDQSVGDGLGLDDQVSGDQLQQVVYSSCCVKQEQHVNVTTHTDRRTNTVLCYACSCTGS
jgi:hypothetical protein